MTDGGMRDPKRVVVLNPASGASDHADRVRTLAGEHGFTVKETGEAGDGITLAREAAEAGIDVIAAAGGDGTIHEVVRGVDQAAAFETVTLGVIPSGTGNNFAGNIGVADIEHAFEVMESGRTRQIDLGYATEQDDGKRPFVNSCICGLTAEASGDTPSDLKERFGVLAYVLTTLQTMRSFDGFELRVEHPARGHLWEGTAIFVLVGNGRRFGPERRTQGNMEDGLFDVAIINAIPPAEIVEEAAFYRLFGTESEHVTRLHASTLDVEVKSDDPLSFSFDGELATAADLTVDVRPGTLELFVGDDYEPNPE